MPPFRISTLTLSTALVAVPGWELLSTPQHMLCHGELGKLFLRSQGQEDTQPQPVLSGAQSSVCFSHLWPLFALMVFTFIEKNIP